MLAQLTHRTGEEKQESLLKLYWNRAGVKRELVTLKREHFELLDKLQQQEDAILRAQNQLEGLERLLTDPLAAANAMVYFQLRHMWRIAAMKVQQFGKELKAQREKRERVQLHNAVLAKRTRRLDAIQEKLTELLEKRKYSIEECVRLEQRLCSMNVVVKLFTGSSLRKQIHGMKQNREALEERIEEFNEIVEKIQGEPLPEPEGMSLDNRRLINIAMIALAQHLVVRFAEHDLARLARKAVSRSVADMKFGDRRVCDQMVGRIREQIAAVNADKQLPDRIKARADYLLNKVQYRNETDATPMPESLAEIVVSPEREVDGKLAEAPIRANVLADDYWDLMNYLY